MRLRFDRAARPLRLAIWTLFVAVLAVPAVWTEAYAQPGTGSILPWLHETAESSIIQVQDTEGKNKQGRRAKKGKRAKGKDSAAKCHEQCLLKKNPTVCQSRCPLGGKADD